ncbi:MAG: EVE domain-containing protein [Phycisphaerales bacterium]|nr:MAG: EVE domain-containing protein [Phycisphaerales bacterium]
MTTWLLKSEPDVYSYDDLVRDQRTHWDGVTSAPAQKHMRAIEEGDEAFIYHSGDEKRIVGLAKVVRGAYEDPDHAGETIASTGEPKFVLFDLAPKKAAKEPVPLSKIKGDKRFAEFTLVKQSRLSVMPVPPALDKVLREWAGL